METQIAKVAAEAAWSDMGTNGLGWLLLFVIPCGVAVRRAWRAPKGQRLDAIRSHWKSELRDVFLITFMAGAAIFAWELVWNQPRQIWTQAKSVRVPVVSSTIPSPTDPSPPHSVGVEISQDVRQSRLEVSKVNLVEVVNKQGKHSNILNVYYINKGMIPTTFAIHRAVVVPSPSLLTSEEQEKYVEIARSAKLPTKFEDQRDDIEPGSPPEHFFSLPEENQIDKFGETAAKVLSSESNLYVFIAFKYRDASLPKGQIRLTQYCGLFYQSFDLWHSCGVNRVSLERER